MKIDIQLPYAGAETQAELWAVSEAKIDCWREPEKLGRCTMAYAAVELKHFLERTLQSPDIRIGEKPAAGRFRIALEACDPGTRGEAYWLIPETNGLVIRGDGRVGVLYGVYELLQMQGWRWYAPGELGEAAPERRERLALPAEAARYESPSPVCRGFAMEGQLKESAELAVWMARNRLNQGAHRPNTRALNRKLGILMRDGGHIFEHILNPDRPTSSGKTLWEAHPAWYGLPAEGKREKAKLMQTQFCVSQPDLLAFLCENLLEHIMGDWYGADQIDVWGFDTWGSVCSCERCRALGNGTDQMLYLASEFRSFLDQARRSGRLDHPVQLVLCAYEGTSSLMPPEKPVPSNLWAAGDYILYATIVRCYAHRFLDPACSYNRAYAQLLRRWCQVEDRLPVVVLEYYNVSKFEDLPILFTDSMRADLPDYSRLGVDGFCYMHLPLVNWGMRTLTQALYAALCWDPDMDVDTLLAGYFQHRYGRFAQPMTELYAQVETAWKYCTSWRAWKDQSLLSTLQAWDGKRPRAPLAVDDHFKTPEQWERMGLESEALMEASMDRLTELLRAEKAEPSETGPQMARAVNPNEIRAARRPRIRQCLQEDLRSLRYGLDTLRLMLRLGQYYQALYSADDLRAAALWRQIERVEESMERYYMPLTFDGDYLGILSLDALTRTQLEQTIDRCRRARTERPAAGKGEGKAVEA